MLPDFETNLERVAYDKITPENISIWERYTRVVRCFENSSRFINSKSPLFTDHGKQHIIHVQNTICKILDSKLHCLNGHELYILCMASYFHDFGNIIDRIKHNLYTHRIYNSIFAVGERNPQEASIIDALVRAHTGVSSTNDHDTLKDISENMLFEGRCVRARTLAAILRFSDELAESKMRTDLQYVMNRRMLPKNLMHHLYANCISININAKESRIFIDFHICFSIHSRQRNAHFIGTGKKCKFCDFVKFIDRRLFKADEERKYANFYLSDFIHFDEISVNIEFYSLESKPSSGEGFRNKVYSVPLCFNDKVIPGEYSRRRPKLNTCDILKHLEEDVRDVY